MLPSRLGRASSDEAATEKSRVESAEYGGGEGMDG
jgi:hypothetical protein